MTAPFTPSELRAAPDSNARNAVIVARGEELKLQPKFLIESQKPPRVVLRFFTFLHRYT